MTARDVKGYCRKALESYRIPSEVRFVSDYPRAQGGKPQKFKLRRRALEEMERQEEHDDQTRG
jgi:fatty-acyl-CoA synthase